MNTSDVMISKGRLEVEGPDVRVLPPFAALRAFEAVFRVGGIRKAATALGLTHAVVSRHIKLLEEWVGTPLVIRSGNRLGLTEAGSAYHARVSSALIELAVATRELRDRQSRNFIRVHSTAGFSVQWLSSQLSDFERIHPKYHVELKPTDDCADLLLHEADVDIRFYLDDVTPPPGGKGLRFLELARPLIVAVTSPEFAKRLRTLKSPDDLLSMPLLHEGEKDLWKAWLRVNGVSIHSPIPGQSYWHAYLAVAAARQGRGIALATAHAVAKDLEDGELVQINVRGIRPTVIGGYMFVARTDRWSTPAMAHLRRFLKSRAAAIGHPSN